ncbi:MAG: hypothetical protein K6G88_15625 [Lachnospiraceae bacterium]|nr:hypothetical protein [Lachnospiraceae bacterium]
MIQCKNCGGNVKFDIKSQKMFCSYCDTYYDPYEFEENEADAEEHVVNDPNAFMIDDTANQGSYMTTIYTCPECAGEIISDENEAATFCTFCGASTVLASRICKSKRPSSIIPFKITKDECKELYRQRMKKAIYAPAEYKDEKYLDSFRGIYMPYWVYDSSQYNYVQLKGKKTYRRGDYKYEETYDIDFNLDAEYNGISYDASSSFADSISGAIAPYDHSKAVKFTPAFFSGFYADTTDVQSDVYAPDVENIVNNSTTDEIEKQPNVKSISIKYPVTGKSAIFNTNVRCKEESMYPVWFVSHRFGDRVTYATVNGYTGKIAADIPIDLKKYILGSLIVAIPIFILLSLFPLIVPRVALYIATIVSVFGFITVLVESKSVKNKDSNIGDKGMLDKVVNNDDDIPKNYNIYAIVTYIISIVIGVIVVFSKPVFDGYYYGAVILELIASILCFLVVIYNYNLLSTRKLPQFKRTGGDDRA